MGRSAPAGLLKGTQLTVASEQLGDQQVLAAVVELTHRYRAPSTTLITWQLADGVSVSGAFQSAVRDALQRLHADGRLACVVHRGTCHWSPTGASDLSCA